MSKVSGRSKLLFVTRMKNAEVESREQCVCGGAGMRECPVSHNSAKLEVKCSYRGRACFSHLGRLATKPDPQTRLSFSACASMNWMWHPVAMCALVYPRMFRKQREAAENPARFHAGAGGGATCCRRRDFIFHSNVNRALVRGYFELRARV